MSDTGRKIRCAVITVSDTRDETTDGSGRLMMELLAKQGHDTVSYQIVPDEPIWINLAVTEAVHNESVELVLLNGGTGIAPRDVTVDAILPLLDYEVPGFGELFRYLSYQYDIGTAAILSRATAGVCNKRLIFSVPGSEKAVRLAMERLILPELVHALREMKKEASTEGHFL